MPPISSRRSALCEPHSFGRAEWKHFLVCDLSNGISQSDDGSWLS